MTEDQNSNSAKNSDAQTPHSDTSTPTPQDVPLPNPTLVGLVSGLASQAMISLGIFPNPIDGSNNILLHQGKHLIDTIALLNEKTKGNQTEEETKTLANVLHELRMIYIAAQNEKQKQNSQ
ncbi:MAG: DUF1844 domain-containing protein [Planctomycetaceae bacterium]|jgi:hypothetical protein|nr:DUF1844 domain-containing protein [Planctomycetaceae bacterium]